MISKNRDIYRIGILFLLIIATSQIAYTQAPDTIWTKTLVGSSNDVGAAVQQTSDAGYIITVWTESYGAGSRYWWLIIVKKTTFCIRTIGMASSPS